MKVISITNAKGGVGKTTVTVNLAYELRQRGHFVLLIDLDDQCDLTKIYRPTDTTSPDILQVLQGQNHILDACIEADENLYLIPGSKNLSHFSFTQNEQLLREHLSDEYLRNFDFVLIDHPPTLNEATLTGYIASDEIIIVTDPEAFSVKNLGQMLDNLFHIQATMNPELRILGILVNKVDMRRSLTKTMLTDLEVAFGDSLFKTWISNDTAIPTSLKLGLPLRKLHWRSRTVDQFSALSFEALERMGYVHVDGETTAEQTANRGD